MRKTYLAPELLVHGSVQHITAASEDSDRQDRIFNASGMLTGTSTGSLDSCYFRPGTEDCIIAPGEGPG